MTRDAFEANDFLERRSRERQEQQRRDAEARRTERAARGEAEPSASDELWDGDAGRLRWDAALAALEAVTAVNLDASGASGMARCPAHADGNPSLSITRDGDHMIVNCFAGCGFAEIMKAIRRGMPDAETGDDRADFDPGVGAAAPDAQGLVTYDYTDAEGKLVYQVCRQGSGKGKRFFQRRPDAGGGWILDVPENMRTLYNLPAVLAAAKKGWPVFVVEGEKDVESLKAASNRTDAPVTTSPCGAGKWLDRYADHLKGCAAVMLLADNDAPGERHIMDVAASCRRRGIPTRRVRLPGLPEMKKGADVTDWFDAVHRDELKQRGAEFAAAVKAAQPFPSVGDFGAIGGAELTALPVEEHPFIVAAIAPVGLTLISAGEKSGKSLLAQQVALSVATGEPLWGRYKTSKGRVLYVSLEQGVKLCRSRLDRALRGGKIPELFNLMPAETPLEALDRGGLDKLERWMAAWPDTRMVVLDVWQFVAPASGQKSANAYERGTEALKPIKQFAHRHGIAVVAVHHTRKGDASEVFEKVSGSRAMVSVPDLVWLMQRKHDDEMAVLENKSRVSMHEKLALKLDPQTLSFDLVGSGAEVVLSAERRQVLAVLKATNEPLGVTDIQGVLKDQGVVKSAGAVKMLLARMVEANEVVKEGRGMYRAPLGAPPPAARVVEPAKPVQPEGGDFRDVPFLGDDEALF